MARRDDWFELITALLVPIHSDGQKYLAVSIGLALLGFLIWSPIGWLFTVAAAAFAFLFRDPERVSPVRDGLIVSPANGTIEDVEMVLPPPELGLSGGERTRISIHISPYDVLMTRAPTSGRVVRAIYVPGAFAKAAGEAAAQENERRAFVIQQGESTEIAVVVIAGFFPRRIPLLAGEGDMLMIGQRLGLVRFGCRVDVYLPPDQSNLVAVGQTSIAGETVFCDVRSDEPARKAMRV